MQATSVYVVKTGDYLVKIAEEHGTTWQEINQDAPHADANGWLTFEFRRAPQTLFIEWAPALTPLALELPHRALFFASIADDRLEAARQRLANLGFSHAAELHEVIRAFQYHYGYAALTGRLEDVEDDLIQYHDHACVTVVVGVGGAPTSATVPAFGVPRERAHATPPPPEPTTLGNSPVGGGTVPGRGTLRPPRPYLWNIRVAGWDLRPVPMLRAASSSTPIGRISMAMRSASFTPSAPSMRAAAPWSGPSKAACCSETTSF